MAQDQPTPDTSPASAPTKSGGKTGSTPYNYYVLIVLTFVYVLNIADRQILVVLQESIKKDLHFSDSQLGVLSGLAFAIFYTILGIPIARLADRKNRRNVIVVAMIIWSVMTAVCGTVTRFGYLLLARIGVGVGEAGCTPPAVSMISDLFAQKKRGMAMAIYTLGVTLGTVLGFGLGGYLNQLYGWRITFLAVGIPGVLIALLVRLTVKEPIRGAADGIAASGEVAPFKDALREMWASPAFVYMALGTAVLGMGVYGISNWSAPFYERVHNMTSAEVGKWLAVAALFGSSIGSFSGGFLADKLSQRSARWHLWVPAFAALLSIPLMGTSFWAESKVTSFVLFGVAWLFGSMWYPPIIALSQGLVTPRNRALSVAIILFLLNFVGMGMGPTVIGIMSDIFQVEHGTNSLRISFSIMLLAYLGAGILLMIGAKHVKAGLEKARESS